jgi:two-component system sensor histidine kinase DegS
VRHSGGRQVRIFIEEEGNRIRLSVQDDSKGFAPSLEPGLGILGMQERVARLGGALQVDSELGRGTIVSFTLPLAEKMETPPAPREAAAQEIKPFRTA